MGLPGHRRTSSHKRRRAAHFALVAEAVTACLKCGANVLPHHLCKKCGFYRGREVVDTSRDVKRVLKRTQAAKAAHAHEHKETKKAETKKTKTPEA